jgi:hypothetical protein
MILDSRIMYVDFEAFLIPMVDFANYKENPKNPLRIFKAKFDETYTTTDIKAGYDVKKGDQLFEDLGYTNDNYLVHHGIALEDNYHDCYSIQLSFSERHDDNLNEMRKEFFGHFFLYDKNHIDVMYKYYY